MPGIVGIVTTPAEANSQVAPARSISEVVPHDPKWASYHWQSLDKLCSMSCFGREYDTHSRIATQGDRTLLLDGELYRVGGNQAEFLLTKFVQEGASGLKQIEGRFIAAIWNSSEKRLTLITDKFASRPLYYRQLPNGFAFGSSINAIRSGVGISPPMNRDGLIQFFTFGHLWNDDTFYDGIKASYSASLIDYDALNHATSSIAYWMPGTLPNESSKAKSMENLSESLANSVSMQTEDSRGLGVALSGGLDARTVLGLVDLKQVHPDCVSLGMEGSLDQKSARRLAELAGCKFHAFVLGEGFLEKFRDHVTRMVELTDGHYLSQCIVMPTFPLYQSLGIRALLRGHAGELIHMHKAYNFSVDSTFKSVQTGAHLETWLAGRLQAYLTDGVEEPLLRGVSREEFAHSGQQSLRKALTRTEAHERPLDRLSRLFLEQRTRRETAMSMVKFNSVVEPRLPFLNGDFMDHVFAADPSLRIGEAIQTFMLRKYRPEFLKPANSNTGASVGASWLVQTVCYYRMRVFAKLGVKGYQPYERLGLWLKQDLRAFVEEVLLDGQCLDRGLFNPDCVRAVVSRHMDSKANHTFLILAFMIVELGLRRNQV